MRGKSTTYFTRAGVRVINPGKDGTVTELSLFSGAGGGLLGTKLLGWRTIGYVEYESYCQKVLKARIKDGILDATPIFGDIRKFISAGYAASYTGMVDVITAGFPCQPFSVAGKQLGADDPRNMWPQTADVIRIVQPRYVLLENVPGIRKYLPVVVRDLRKLGYDVRRPLQLGADDVGAPHRRKRLWIVAQSQCQCLEKSRVFRTDISLRSSEAGTGYKPEESEKDVADAINRGSQDRWAEGTCEGEHSRNENNGSKIEELCGSRWSTQPRLGRVADELACRLDKPGTAI